MLVDSDVKDFLTHLAVDRKVAASTQNQAFNALLFLFDTGMLTVHDGKGKKDRTVPRPEKIVPELKDHLESVIKLHQEDLRSGYAGAFLPSSIEKKYKNAARWLACQWFFPAKTMTYVYLSR